MPYLYGQIYSSQQSLYHTSMDKSIVHSSLYAIPLRTNLYFTAVSMPYLYGQIYSSQQSLCHTSTDKSIVHSSLYAITSWDYAGSVFSWKTAKSATVGCETFFLFKGGHSTITCILVLARDQERRLGHTAKKDMIKSARYYWNHGNKVCLSNNILWSENVVTFNSVWGFKYFGDKIRVLEYFKFI